MNAVLSQVAGNGLTLGHSPARGILGMFMDENLLHLHLHLEKLQHMFSCVAQLSVHHADFFRFHTRPQQEREVVTWRTSRKKLGLLSLLQSSKFNSVVFKAQVPHCSIASCSGQVHCEPFTLHATRISTD